MFRNNCPVEKNMYCYGEVDTHVSLQGRFKHLLPRAN